MSRYKKRIAIIVVSLTGLLLAGNLIYRNYIRIQNVFDQMYYTRIRTHYDWWCGALGGFGNKATSFSKMPQIKPVSRDSESNYTADGYFESRYLPECLGKGEKLSIGCDRNIGTVYIEAKKSLMSLL